MSLRRIAKRLLGHVRTIQTVGACRVLAFHVKPANTKISVQIAGHNITLRARSSDLKVAMESLLKEYAFLDDLLPRDFEGFVVDAGGYIGTAAIAFASRYPKAQVLIIEPSSHNLEILRMNIAPFSNITVRHAALGDTAGGTITLRERATGNWGFTIVETGNDGECTAGIEEVPLTSLAEIMQEIRRPIDFLKLDIEGAEKRIFDENAENLRNIPLVFVELHDRFVPGCTNSFRSFSQGRWVLRLGGEKFISITTASGQSGG